MKIIKSKGDNLDDFDFGMYSTVNVKNTGVGEEDGGDDDFSGF